MRNPEGFGDLLRKKRNDRKELGLRLTNREIYNYFKDCRIVKYHKSAEIIRKNCLTIKFMGELKESLSDIFRAKLPSFLKEWKSF